MKKLFLILFLAIFSKANSQIDWSHYSTSFRGQESGLAIGVGIPYNGIYDNFNSNIVGISHWNPQYKLNIDTALNDNIPLFFVYDTTSVFFLFPGVSKTNSAEFEFTVLLNNQTVVLPWSKVNAFSETSIGGMNIGSGMSEDFNANLNNYLVVHLRNIKQRKQSSLVVYFQQSFPSIKNIFLSNNADAFTKLIKNTGVNDNAVMGWHRQYSGSITDIQDTLRFSHNENNILVELNNKIFKRDAVEYTLLKGETLVRNWGENEQDNKYILLKNLTPGEYTFSVRLSRQKESIKTLHFSISPAWYQTSAFWIVFITFFTLLALLSFLIFKNRRQNQKMHFMNKDIVRAREELKSIHYLLNPHFTFNALNSIQALVNKGEVNAANKYLSSFGELLRQTLRESKSETIPIVKELDNLRIYVGLEQLRYQFNFIIDIDKCINPDSTLIPPFLLQPFVENAIKHALSKKAEQSVLRIDIRKIENQMVIVVSDNGQGFNVSSSAKGHGLSLSKKRIELLNLEYEEELIKLNIESSDNGTNVTISFLNWF